MRNYSKATKRYEDGGIVPASDDTQTVNRAAKGDRDFVTPSLEGSQFDATDEQKRAAKADLGVLLKRRAKMMKTSQQ